MISSVAEKLDPHLKVMVTATAVPPYTSVEYELMAATYRNPSEVRIENNLIHVDIQSVLVVRKDTGEILSRADIPNKQRLSREDALQIGRASCRERVCQYV